MDILDDMGVSKLLAKVFFKSQLGYSFKMRCGCECIYFNKTVTAVTLLLWKSKSDSDILDAFLPLYAVLIFLKHILRNYKYTFALQPTLNSV